MQKSKPKYACSLSKIVAVSFEVSGGEKFPASLAHVYVTVYVSG